MKTRLMLRTLALPALLSTLIHQPSTCLAEGTAFTYQGLLNSQDAPANGVYDLRFAIFDLPTGGLAIAPVVTHANVSVSNGLFTVVLDFGSAVFTGGPRWMEIAVRTNGAAAFTALSPRQPVLPAPYAIFAAGAARAADADRLNGQDATAFSATGHTHAANEIASGVLAPVRGGTGLDTSGTPAGSLLYTSGAGVWAALPAGANGQVLKVGGGVPAWGIDNDSGGTVTSISSGAGLIGGPVTTTGTLAIDPAVVPRLGAANTFNTGPQTIQTAAAANRGLILRGAPGQGAALQEWQDSAGAVVASMSPAGVFTGGGSGLTDLNGGALVAGSVATSALADGAVTAAKIATGAVGSSQIQDGAIVNADIGSAAAIADTKLATISTPGKVANPATTAASANTANAIVARDATGSFSAGTITAAFSGNGAGLTALNASQLSSGTVPGGRLAGTYDQALTFSNPANTFSGSGAGLTGLNADQLATGTVPDARLAAVVSRLGQSIESAEITDGTIQAADVNAATFDTTFWRAVGNAGTTAGTHFLGTTDAQPLEMKVNGLRALRLEDNGDGEDSGTAPDAAPNVIGGSPVNFVAAGMVGVTIGGGGAGDYAGAGHTNAVLSDYGTLGGGLGNRVDRGSVAATIAGGQSNDIFTNSSFSAIGGGFDNKISTNSSSATIAGGIANDIGAGSDYSVIGGGNDNGIASISASATVAGGIHNDIGINSFYSSIGGGSDNNVGGGSVAVTIGGGDSNETGNNSGWSTIGGGYANRTPANAQFATIPGGTFNFATNHALAAGRRAKAGHTGAFVWGDSTNADIASTNANSVTLRAAGGYRLFSDGGATAGVFLAAGGTSWAVISDRNVKKDFAAVDSEAVLEKLASLPISRWRYQWEGGEATPHIGPMAQDFKAAFYPGRDDRSITSQEVDGVALAAIQGLNEKVEVRSQNAEVSIRRLQAQNAELKARLAKLEELITAISTKGN